MAALTASRNTPEWNSGNRRYHLGGSSGTGIPVEASSNIYVGGMVCRDANGNAVKAQALGSSPLNRLQVLGICEYVYAGGILPPGINALNQSGNGALYPSATGTLGAAGAISVGVVVGTFGMDVDSTISNANVGELCFVSDDHTVSLGTAVANTTAIAVPANTVATPVVTIKAGVSNIVQGTFAATLGSGGTGTVLVEGTDYTVDYQTGTLAILLGGLLVNLGGNFFASYSYSAAPCAGRIVAIDGGLCYVNFDDKGAVL